MKKINYRLSKINCNQKNYKTIENYIMKHKNEKI